MHGSGIVCKARGTKPRWSCAAISTSRLKTRMFTIPISGAARSCVRRANAKRSMNCAGLVWSIRCACTIRTRVSLVGGITGCFRFRRTVACESTRSWRVKYWRLNAPRRESTARCAKERNLPITRRSGRNFYDGAQPRVQPTVETARDLRRRLPFLPALDRAVARTYSKRSRVRAVPGSRGKLSRNFEKGFRRSAPLHRQRRKSISRSGSRLPVVRLNPVRARIDLVLRACPRVRALHRNGLQLGGSQSPGRLIPQSPAMGQRRSPPDLLQEQRPVCSLARRRLPDRFRLALASDRWIDR